jgi:hypothetical protein
MKPLFVAPLSPTRTIAVYHRPGEGYICVEREWRDGRRHLDLSTQRGPYADLERAIMTARWIAAQARRAA